MKLQLIAAGGVAALVAGFGAGWQVNDWRMGQKLEAVTAQHEALRAEAKEQARQAEVAAREVERAAQERSDAIAEVAEARRRAREAEGEVITREIVRYVERNPGACQLDTEWVRIHDIATHSADASRVSANPGTASELDANTGTVTASDSLLIITNNYRRCNTARDQLIALQGWVREVTQQRAE